MPRSYRLGLREGSKAETRARIVTAALEIVRDRGLAGASNLAIARAADVAPATVRNHFPTPDALATATFDALLTLLEVPTPAIVEGLDALAARVERIAMELAALYERSEPWWRAYEREPQLISAWAGGVDRYYAEVDRLMRAALGDLGDDDEALAVLAAVVGPPTFFALRGRGVSSDRAVALSVELAVPWLEQRRASRDSARTDTPAANRRRSRARPAGRGGRGARRGDRRPTG
jgi:AcrR family transcriptional regulator